MRRLNEMVSRVLAIAGIGMLMLAAAELPRAEAMGLFCQPDGNTSGGCAQGWCGFGKTCSFTPFWNVQTQTLFCCVVKTANPIPEE